MGGVAGLANSSLSRAILLTEGVLLGAVVGGGVASSSLSLAILLIESALLGVVVGGGGTSSSLSRAILLTEGARFGPFTLLTEFERFAPLFTLLIEFNIVRRLKTKIRDGYLAAYLSSRALRGRRRSREEMIHYGSAISASCQTQRGSTKLA